MNVVWMIVSGLLMASMGVCVKLVGGVFGLGATVIARGAIPALIIGAWTMLAGQTFRTPHWRSHVYRSSVGAMGMLLYFTAIPRLPLATAVTLSNTSALFMAIILSFKRRPPLRALLALSAGFVGVALVLRPTIGAEQWLWGLVGLASGLTACIAQLKLHELGRAREPEWRTVFFHSSLCTLLAIPFAMANPPGLDTGTRLQWILLLMVGVFGGVAQLALSRAFRKGHPLMNGSLVYLNVVFSSLAGIPLWGDTLSPLSWLGMAIIVAAGIVSGHPATWQRRQ